MTGRLENKKFLFLVENIFDEIELFYPKYRLLEEKAQVVIAGPQSKEVYTGKYGYPCTADVSFQEIKESEFDALYIPGGYAPDKLRRSSYVLELVRQFFQKEKKIGFICHAGSVLISAKILKGFKCTSFSSIKEDMINAGAYWVDEPVVVDRNLISSRNPDDLPVFCQTFIQELA